MTISYNLAPQPRMRFVYPSTYGAAAGQPIVGGKLYTYQSLNHVNPKTTYSSNVGSPPSANSNPIDLDPNGEAIVYWALYSTNINDLYYVELRDPNDNLIYAWDNYDGASLSAGSTTSTDELINFVRNPQFSCNRFKDISNVSSATDNWPNSTYVVDDWMFVKNNTTCQETVSVVPFTLGQTDVPFNPINYLEWNVTTTGSGETKKQLYQNYSSVVTLSGQTVTLQFYAKSSSLSNLTVSLYQNFGSGGSPSATNIVPIFTQALTNTWTAYSATVLIPDLSGKTIGSNGDDVAFLVLDLPLNASAGATIDMANVDLKLGSTATYFQYQTVEQYQKGLSQDWFNQPSGTWSIINATTAPRGWIKANDGTIGNSASGATTYDKEDAYPLYTTLWNTYADAQCPVSTGRGANALADFNANKTIKLPLTASRLVGNSGAGSGLTSRVPGVTGGAETHTNTLAEIAQHTHAFPGGVHVGGLDQAFTGVGYADGSPSINNQVPARTGSPDPPGIADITATDTTPSGATQAWNIMNPFSFLPWYLKL